MRLSACVLASLVLLALTPALAPAKTFRGETKQQRPVTVQTGADGVPTLVRIPWKARCRRNEGRASFEDRTDFRPAFDVATVDAVQDEGTYRLRDRGGFRHRVTVTLRGERVLTDPANPASEVWRGTVRATIAVRRHGRSYDSCTLRSTAWVARPV